MNRKRDVPSKTTPAMLRDRAEAVMRKSRAEIESLSSEEIKVLVHELRVHQIELELQNEELRRAQEELAHSRDRLSDLYDFAPVGYVTLDENGTVLEANLTAAKKLGVERSALVGKKFTRFVARESQDALYHHQREVLSHKEKQTCELLLRCKDGSTFCAEMESIRNEEPGRKAASYNSVISDITQRKKAEEALAEESALLRALFDLVPGSLYIKNTEHQFVLANNEVARVMGAASPEALVGRTDADFYPGETAAEFLADERGIFKTGQPLIDKDEFRPGINSGTLYILTSKTPLKDSQGRITGLVGIGTDITGRKLVGDALKKSEERLRIALQAASAGAWDWDLGTGQIVWSPENYVLYGCDPAKGPPTYDLWESRVHPEDQARANKAISDALERRTPEFRAEFRIILPWGAVRWLQGLGRVEHAESGRPLRMSGINIDITARKLAEEELQRLNATLDQRVVERTALLKEREERLRAILDTVADAIITIDGRGVIESVNPATERIFGYTEAELVGKNVSILMPSPHREEHDSHLARYNRTSRAKILGTSREMQGRRKDGTIFPIEQAVSELDGRRVFIGVVRDITRRKELEVEVLRISEEERLRVAADLHDGICQELVGISFTLSAAYRGLKRDDPLLAKLREIEKALATATNHTRQLARGMKPVVADSAGLIYALQRLSETITTTHRIRCRFDCPERDLIEAQAVSEEILIEQTAANQLYLIAQEAIHNAIRHGNAKHVTVRLTLEDGEACLSVIDNGAGLPAHDEQAFGMGMRVMKYRAGLIGGDLTIGPRKGGGTRILCRIAALRVASPEPKS